MFYGTFILLSFQFKSKVRATLLDIVGKESPSEPHMTRSLRKKTTKSKGRRKKVADITSFPQTVKNEVDLTLIEV